MDIFIISTKNTDNIDSKILNQYSKKSISDKNKRKIHELSYLMLDKIFKKIYKINNCEIIFENKKPILKSKEKYFSISHSNEYITIAFSDFDCGIDIEEIKQRNYRAISKKMNFCAKSLKDFYYSWTKYEAEYKHAKQTNAIKQFEFENYIISAVSSNPEEKFEIYFQMIE